MGNFFNAVLVSSFMYFIKERTALYSSLGVGYEPINRSKPKKAIVQTLDEGSERLKEGLFVLLFPEGTRVKAGEVGAYARSSFELAKRNKVRVLPVCHNSGDCWPAHKFIKQPGTIKLYIGLPFEVVDSKKSAEEVRTWTEQKLNLIN